MVRHTTNQFTDLDAFQAGLGELNVELVAPSGKGLAARLTRAALPHLTLLSVQESVPRAAVITMSQRSFGVTLPLLPESGLVDDGVALQRSDIVVQAPGERAHQRTARPGRWAMLLLDPDFVAAYAGALTGRRDSWLPTGSIVRPMPSDRQRLVRLLRQIELLAVTKPIMLDHPEVARAMEQDVIHALVVCVENGEVSHHSGKRRRYAQIMAGFEAALAQDAENALPLSAVCRKIGVSGRTLSTCCADLLGVSPGRYAELLRLKRVRAAIAAADPTTARVGDIARGFGFKQAGRFAGTYRAAFGETPSETLRRVGIPSEISKSA